ncbi:MAG: homocysteine S-methyltransferase family protein [Acidobacteriota bacterium]
MTRPSLSDLLKAPRPILIDGAVGTELGRRGVHTTLPLWSAHALVSDHGLGVLRGIHSDYARAGADILVTNTFRTTLRCLGRAGRGEQWRLLNRRAVDAARAGASAAAGRPCLVAGGIAPLEDCYRPDLVPPDDECRAEHRRQADLLAGLGVDLVIVETMNSRREAEAALVAARDTGLDVVLSLCPRPPGHLLSGEPLGDAVPALLDAGGPRLRAVLLNCAPPEVLEEVYPRLIPLVGDRPHGLYAHLGHPDEATGWKLPEKHEPDGYALWVADRLRQGARLVGGCCGTTPDHIAALSRLIPP